jgi:hypothetical protein
MDEHNLQADYVIAGAGAIGLAFADTLLTDSTATMIIADRRAKPGGHWLDAYPFVRLHGPSATYGVESQPLGSGAIDAVGLNQGLHELAGGAEICAYFDRLMQQRLLPSGRVVYLSRHEIGADGVATSLVSGRRSRLLARRKWVDATVADTQVPATHAPRFRVAKGARCVTPSELVRLHEPPAGHVIVGGGKTAMDTALWLLEQGADPNSITWIRPREAWLLNRANVQPTRAFVTRTLAAITAELEAACGARTLHDLFARLEAARLLLRIDPTVAPTMYRCAIVSEAELAQLQRIRRVVRLGHVQAIERDRIVLDQGALPTSPAQVHVHCSAAGLPRGPAQPVFQGRRIVPQYVRRCSPTFSAAFIAHLEATIDGGDDEKNALCQPVPVPEAPLDWLRMHLHTAANQVRWSQRPALQDWLRRSRLEAYAGLFEQAARQADPQWTALQQRLRQARPDGLRRIGELLAAQVLPVRSSSQPSGRDSNSPISVPIPV